MAAPLIFAQMAKVMADIGHVAKDQKNEQQKYSFRGIDNFYNAAHSALSAHGVFIAPEVLERAQTDHERAYEGRTTVWRHVVLKVRHRFFASDGSFVDVTTFGEGLDNSDKATNKAMSGAMKYCLIETFSVPTADIDDADKTTPTVAREARTFTAKPKESVPAQSGAGASTSIKGTGPAQDAPVSTAPLVAAVIKTAEQHGMATSAPKDGDTYRLLTREEQIHLHKYVEGELGLGRKDFKAWLASQHYVKPDGEGSSAVIAARDMQKVKLAVKMFVEGANIP